MDETEKRNHQIRATIIDREKIDQIINKHHGRANALIQILLEIQHENHWIPHDVLDKVSQKLGVPLSRIMQIVTFHTTFRLIPRGRHEIQVCTGSSCHVRGSAHLLNKIQALIGIQPGETDPDSTFSLETGNCAGCCHLGPGIIIDGRSHPKVTPDGVREALSHHK